jgi:hypothetical protein
MSARTTFAHPYRETRPKPPREVRAACAWCGALIIPDRDDQLHFALHEHAKRCPA